MKCVIQRVRRASVSVGEETVARIEAGLLVLAAVEKGDTEQTMRDAAKKSGSCGSSPTRPGR